MPFVYPDACILEPTGKLILFKQARFGGGPAGRWVERYKKNCRERYVKDYESMAMEDLNPRKRQREESSDEEQEELSDYHSFLHHHSYESEPQNEFD